MVPEGDDMSQSLGIKMIGVLAAVQGVAGALRAFYWFDVGSDLLGQGLLLLPLVGVLAFARGAIVIVLALLCLLFAYGVFTGRSWARPLGIVISIVNLLLVINLMFQGDSVAAALPWGIIPTVVLFYLFSSAGRRALAHAA
jgi:hypothetical protein